MTRTREENAADLAHDESTLNRAALVSLLCNAFETRTRDNGDEFTCLADDRPEWMTDIVMAAHDAGEMLPDDWRYRMIREVCDTLNEIDPDEWEDEATERCDGLVGIFNHDLLHWLASHLDRPGYCDMAVDEGLVAPESATMTRIGCGQFMEYQEIWHTITREIESLAEE